MKPNPIFVAAAGFAMVGACTVSTDDNSAGEASANGATNAAEGSVLPVTDEEAPADTLGNQLNQLNADAADANAAANSE